MDARIKSAHDAAVWCRPRPKHVMAGHSRSKNGVLSHAYSRSKNGVLPNIDASAGLTHLSHGHCRA
jgi:hypothetical protein